MDANRFAALARWLLSLPSRRALLGLGLSGLLGVTGADLADARKKKKKCKKKCGPCQKCKKGKCKPKGNGTSCGEDRTCGSGQCLCAEGFVPCDGACCADCGDPGIPATCAASCPPDAITLSDCDGGLCCACESSRRVCNGLCVDACPSGQRYTDNCQCVAGA